MIVRVVQPPDEARLAEAFPESEGAPESRHLARRRLQERGVLTALAVWNGDQPVGYCAVRWRAADGEASGHAHALGCAELADVFVAVAWRRQGAGRALVEAAERLARQRGERALGLEVTVANPGNDAARRLYEILGYQDAGLGEFNAGYSYFLPDGTTLRDEEPHRYLIKQLAPA